MVLWCCCCGCCHCHCHCHCSSSSSFQYPKFELRFLPSAVRIAANSGPELNEWMWSGWRVQDEISAQFSTSRSSDSKVAGLEVKWRWWWATRRFKGQVWWLDRENSLIKFIRKNNFLDRRTLANISLSGDAWLESAPPTSFVRCAWLAPEAPPPPTPFVNISKLAWNCNVVWSSAAAAARTLPVIWTVGWMVGPVRQSRSKWANERDMKWIWKFAHKLLKCFAQLT